MDIEREDIDFSFLRQTNVLAVLLFGSGAKRGESGRSDMDIYKAPGRPGAQAKAHHRRASRNAGVAEVV